jgi:hypothetical protein
MSVALGILAGVALLAGIYLMVRGGSDRLARSQAEALLATERLHRLELERVADRESLARLEELDAQIDAVRDADGAARLVREQLSRRRARRAL